MSEWPTVRGVLSDLSELCTLTSIVRVGVLNHLSADSPEVKRIDAKLAAITIAAEALIPFQEQV